MRVVLILIWINIMLLIGHILYQFLRCCYCPQEVIMRAMLKQTNIPDVPEKPELPPPPPPVIIIAPPKDIEIPSAGVDVEHGTELKH